jgi:hypothetical protein
MLKSLLLVSTLIFASVGIAHATELKITKEMQAEMCPTPFDHSRIGNQKPSFGWVNPFTDVINSYYIGPEGIVLHVETKIKNNKVVSSCITEVGAIPGVIDIPTPNTAPTPKDAPKGDVPAL